MRKTICGLVILVGLMSIQNVYADRYGLNKTEKELSDFFWDFGYSLSSISTAPITSVTNSITLLGYGTDLHAYYIGGAKTSLYLSTSTVSGGFEIPLVSGQNYEQEFYVPISSPTVLRYSITAGTTLQITVGGIKK